MKNIMESKCYDKIYVVCADGWRDYVTSFSEQFGISGFSGVIKSGSTRFQSFKNGLTRLNIDYRYDEIISIMDANRPLTPKVIFENSMMSIAESDCVLPLEPCFDTIYNINHDTSTVANSVDRNRLFRGQGPETCRIGLANELCNKAQIDNITDLTITEIMLHYNKKVSYIEGSERNFKITTKDDFSIFKALVNNKQTVTDPYDSYNCGLSQVIFG